MTSNSTTPTPMWVICEDPNVVLDASAAVAWLSARGRIVRQHAAWCIDTTPPGNVPYKVWQTYTRMPELMQALHRVHKWVVPLDMHFQAACKSIGLHRSLVVPHAVATRVAELACDQCLDLEDAVWDIAPEPARRIWKYLLCTYALDFIVACDTTQPGIACALAAVATVARTYKRDAYARRLARDYLQQNVR